MLATELLFAVLACERQEIDEITVLRGALVSDCEKSGRRFRGCDHGYGIRIRVSEKMRLSQAYICLDQRGHASSFSPDPFRTYATEAKPEGEFDYVSQLLQALTMRTLRGSHTSGHILLGICTSVFITWCCPPQICGNSSYALSSASVTRDSGGGQRGSLIY